jgi:mRNA interferase HigB
MIVRSPEMIESFAERHEDARTALERWLSLAETQMWRSLAELRATFPNADGVVLADGYVMTIFNIKGNKYRLITAIDYEFGVVIVSAFLTHAQYDKQKWKRR